MRRLSISVLAALLLVGLVAAPAAADRDYENGNFPHYSFVFAFGVFFGEPDPLELPTGEWAEFGAGWGTVTADQRQHFLDTAIVEIERDGVPQDYGTYPWFNDDPEAEFPYGVSFLALTEPGKANTPQVWTYRTTFTEEHFDGEVTIPEGTIIEVSRTIVWVPRGQFTPAD
jgi:hypothetical protein